VRFEFWDGSAIDAVGHPGTIHVRSKDLLRQVLWAPNELGLSRAFVAGNLDVAGDVFEILRTVKAAFPRDWRLRVRVARRALQACWSLGALRLPAAPPAEEARPHGWRHSKRRDAQAISYHYDVGNDFYRLILDPSMTYSCARFVQDSMSLEDAQAAKYELICQKLGLPTRQGMRLLDVGCGWGSMALYAAKHYGARVVGITISEAQCALARRRVADAGLTDQVEIRLEDYREVRDESFDVISSIGMSEHVGGEPTAEYFEILQGLLRPHGRLLNHAISAAGGFDPGRHSFFGRYVFPDGELMDVGDVVLMMERAGFEVRDVESLREHYPKTLRAWVANLESNWALAVAEVGTARARIWHLWMASLAVAIEDGNMGVHQVLGVLPDTDGRSGMPATRLGWT
jgi:cyclopropane-fatty-acyl-phospholipid synthase